MPTDKQIVRVLVWLLFLIAVWWIGDVTVHMRRLERLEGQFKYMHGDKIPREK